MVEKRQSEGRTLSQEARLGFYTVAMLGLNADRLNLSEDGATALGGELVRLYGSESVADPTQWDVDVERLRSDVHAIWEKAAEQQE